MADSAHHESVYTLGTFLRALAGVEDDESLGFAVREVGFLQPPAPMGITPRMGAEVGLPGIGLGFESNVLGPESLPGGLFGSARGSPPKGPTNSIPGSESTLRQSTDAGSLLGRSPGMLGVATQKRTPIINDPRNRGVKEGQLLAGGSHWAPARQDLDTMISKIDSALLSGITVIKGPYSARYGPGFSFIDFQLADSPRYQGGFQVEGLSGVDYHTNAEAWTGRQILSAGSCDWGVRAAYNHRTASDYYAGNGARIPSGYNWRDFDIAIGRDLGPDAHLEFNYLRVDQTRVLFPGQVYDFDFLGTDGFELRYLAENLSYCDQFSAEGWYNQTRFAGTAQNPSKRQSHWLLNDLGFIGLTNGDQHSTGYSVAWTWGQLGCRQLTFGTDLRVVKQRIDEFNGWWSSGRSKVPDPWNYENFLDAFDVYRAQVDKTVPHSTSTNPGLLLDCVLPGDDLVVRAGGRFDWVGTAVQDSRFLRQHNLYPLVVVRRGIFNPADYSWVPFPPNPPDPARPFDYMAPMVPNEPGDLVQLSEHFPERHFPMGSGYVTAEYKLNGCWTALGGFGYAMRPPTLTELYAFNGPFLALIQRGASAVFGNPHLNSERMYQVDAGLTADYGRFRAGVTAFHAWIQDYITFRPVVPFGAGGFSIPERVSVLFPVEFTNTDLATLVGGEVFANYDWSAWLTLFARLSYVEGTDRTRASSGLPKNPTIFVYYSPPPFPPPPYTLTAAPPDEEPLPGIVPLESRIGLHIHPPCEHRHWGIELSARVVADQKLVARTLGEQPTPGFTTWDLRTYWRPRDQMLLVAGIENFTNAFYREHLDLRPMVFQPGINSYFGAEMRY